MRNKVNIKLLIVDDHKIVREGIKILLEQDKDIEIVGDYDNGQSAIDFIKKNAVDIVLLDIDMPGLNGIDTTKLMLLENPQLLIIGLSMHSNKNIVEKLINAGAKGYVLKNTDADALLFAIKNIQNGFQIIDSGIKQIQKSNPIPTNSKVNLPLTQREIEILKMIAIGGSNKDISEKLFISIKTVDTHRTSIMKKLDLHNIAGLVRYAITNGLIE